MFLVTWSYFRKDNELKFWSPRDTSDEVKVDALEDE